MLKLKMFFLCDIHNLLIWVWIMVTNLTSNFHSRQFKLKSISLYYVRIMNRNYRITYIDQCITKYVLHVYSLTQDIYSVVLAGQSNSPISQFNSPCNESTSVWL